jgi:cytochrome c553
MLALLFILTSLTHSGILKADGDPVAGKVKGYTCTGCHGIPGYKNSYPMYKVPKIGGQNRTYLIAALTAYQTGERPHPTMMLQAESLNQTDISDIASWLTSVEMETLAVTDARNSPAGDKTQICQTCHGVDGLGTDPAYPALAGQHSSYIIRALRDYRDGARKNTVMSGFARNLTDQDIEDLAGWYSGLRGLRDLSGR